MPMLFTCPHCGTQTLVDDQYLGHTGPCAVCGKQVTVPLPPRSLEPSRSAAGERASAVTGPPAPGGGSRRQVLVILGLSSLGVVACLAVVGILVALLLPAMNMARTAADRASCRDHLARLGLALRQYAEYHGSYPPAYVTDQNGKRMHSWRVLLLPYLGRDDLYVQYDLNQPWDSPDNMALLPQMPAVFGCPADPDAQLAAETNFMVVVGSETLFPGPTAVPLDTPTDPDTDILLLVEVRGSGVSWLEPRDVELSGAGLTVNSGLTRTPSSRHAGGIYILTADGTPRFVRNGTPGEFLEAAATIRGSESIPWDELTGP